MAIFRRNDSRRFCVFLKFGIDWLKTVSRSGAKALVSIDHPTYVNQITWQDLPVSSFQFHDYWIGCKFP